MAVLVLRDTRWSGDQATFASMEVDLTRGTQNPTEQNIWEQNIKEWYDKSGTSRLNYLDLALIEKPSSKELAHNISVVYDRVCLSSKVNLKEFRSQQLQIQSLEGSVQQLTRKVEKLEKGISSLTQVCLENQSISSTKVQLKPIEALLQQIKGALIE